MKFQNLYYITSKQSLKYVKSLFIKKSQNSRGFKWVLKYSFISMQVVCLLSWKENYVRTYLIMFTKKSLSIDRCRNQLSSSMFLQKRIKANTLSDASVSWIAISCEKTKQFEYYNMNIFAIIAIIGLATLSSASINQHSKFIFIIAFSVVKY